MPILPRYWSNREYESPLHEHRVAQGLFVRELVELSGVGGTEICALANGSLAPTDRDGQPRRQAKALAEALGVDLEDLFPRYFCPLKREAAYAEADIFKTTTGEESVRWAEDVAAQAERADIIARVLGLIERVLTPKERIVFMGMNTREITMEEIGKRYGVSRTRIQQIERKAKDRLVYHARRDTDLCEQFDGRRQD